MQVEPHYPQNYSSSGTDVYKRQVMLGNTELSQGNADPYTLTDIDIMNEPEAPAPDVSEPETVPPVEAVSYTHLGNRPMSNPCRKRN